MTPKHRNYICANCGTEVSARATPDICRSDGLCIECYRSLFKLTRVDKETTARTENQSEPIVIRLCGDCWIDYTGSKMDKCNQCGKKIETYTIRTDIQTARTENQNEAH